MICKMFIKVLYEYNIDKQRKILIVFDNMIADMINNKKLNSIVTEYYPLFYYENSK